jgi:transposase
LTSKIHTVVDGAGRPLAFVVTAGNVNDCTAATSVMERIRVARIGCGRARTRPDRVVADKAYSTRAFRAWLRDHRIGCTIPERADQQANRHRRGTTGGRPYAFDTTIYKRRYTVERYFHRLKQHRGIATRYDKTLISYTAAINLTCLLEWI